MKSKHRVFTGIPKDTAQGLQALGHLTKLQLVPGNRWKDPPEDIVRKGLGEIVRYLETVTYFGAVESWKLKVVLVGAVKAGKTSLVRGMIHGEPRLCDETDRTKGVDVHVDDPCKPIPGEDLELVFWDFAGHSNYYHCHHLFLSAHALHLLVVDLKRFSETPGAHRGDLVDVWLDALQRKVPGSSVLVVATQIDRLAGDHGAVLRALEEAVKARIHSQREQFQRAFRNSSTNVTMPRYLIVHGVEAVSAAHTKSLLALREKLADLVMSKPKLFPSVGQVLPVSWARLFAVLNAKRSGKNTVLEASRVCSLEGDRVSCPQGISSTIGTGIGVNFIRRADAAREWNRVVRALKLEREVDEASNQLNWMTWDQVPGLRVGGGEVGSNRDQLFMPTIMEESIRNTFEVRCYLVEYVGEGGCVLICCWP